MKLLNTKTLTLLLSASAILSMTGCSGDGENGATSEKNLLTEGQPPVAVAEIAPTTMICPSATPVNLTYDGTKSMDPDGEIISYEWFVHIAGKDEIISTQIKGEVADICGQINDIRGTYEVSLTVEDDDGNRVTDMVEVKVVDNKPPVAQAGADKAIEKGVSITLDGKDSSDPDGQILKYSWNIDGIVTEAMTVDTPDTWNIGEHKATLTVTDDVGNTGSDTVVITVFDGATNSSPDAIISQPKDKDTYICDGDGDGDGSVTSITLDGSTSTDPDGDPLSFAWSGTSNGVQLKELIVDKDIAKTSIPLGSLSDEESFCGVVSENCNSTNDSSGRCIVIFNLDVSDGKVSDNAQVTVYLQLPI